MSVENYCFESACYQSKLLMRGAKDMLMRSSNMMHKLICLCGTAVGEEWKPGEPPTVT